MMITESDKTRHLMEEKLVLPINSSQENSPCTRPSG